MIHFEINGKRIRPRNFGDAIMQAVLVSLEAQIREKLGSIRDPETGEPAPYILVRGRLEAKLARPVFYELAEMAVAADEDENLLGVWSNGVFFPLGPAE